MDDTKFDAPVTYDVTLTASESVISKHEHDYIMLAIFTRIQHRHFDKANALIDALITAGEVSKDLLFARAVVENNTGQHARALKTVRELERIDPASMAASSLQIRRARMRAYIKARACFETSEVLDEEYHAALDFYLRHGKKAHKA